MSIQRAAPRWSKFSMLLRACMEVILLGMVAIAPWAFGSVHPLAELPLFAGLFLILILWALRTVVEVRLLWSPCGVSLGLAAMCVLGILQLIPLPDTLLHQVSPQTAKLYDQLVPNAPELAPDTLVDAPALRRPTSLSLVPFATRQVVIHLMAALALFAAIRANMPSPATLYRLAVVAVINGVLLSLVGLLQFFSSPRDTVFWIFPSEGQVFGPFICRNHFAYFINLSIGLGLGLLWSRRHFDSTLVGRPKAFSTSGQGILQDPVVLWIGSGLTVMVAGLILSLSRGGMVALLAGAVVCMLMKLWYSRRFYRLSSGLFLAALGLGAAFWFGYDYAGKRLASLWETNVLDEGRGPVWSRVIALVPDFPLLGTGLGTFSQVEPLTRLPMDGYDIIHDHVHNDYLEALIEGGIVQLCLVLGIIFLIFQVGIRTYANLRNARESNLVLGCLFGLAALFVHSVVDFGMHITAVALLAIVVAALLLNLQDWSSWTADYSDPPPIYKSPWAFGAIPGVLVLVTVAFFLLDSAWRSEQAERYRLAASLLSSHPGPEQEDKKVAYLDAALAYAPENPLLEVSLAEAYQQRSQARKLRLQTANAVQNAFGFDRTQPWSALGTWAVTEKAVFALRSAGRHERTDLDLAKALSQHVEARSHSPLLVQPHLFLAAYPEFLSDGRSAAEYLDRVCFLDPANPKNWYAAGLEVLRKSNQRHCWECWRRSLMCAPTFLSEILVQAGNVLSPRDLIATVFPDDPALLYEAALRCESNELGGSSDRMMTKALAILECAPPPMEEAQLLLQARIQVRLKQVPAAKNSYEQLLSANPNQLTWRLEFSDFLMQAGLIREARKEILTLLSFRPNDQRAKSLYDTVIRELAEKDGPRINNK